MNFPQTVGIGVIGAGHWGPNHVRIFSQLAPSKVVMVADLDEKRLSAITTLFPSVQATQNYKDILNHPNIDAVVIAVPTQFHFKLAQEALIAGKHVLCEKPLSLDPQECLVLDKLSKEKNKILMVGHIFVFNAGLVKMREYIQSKELGEIHYAHSERTNLGPFRYDVNALWDLAPHDISIFNFLFDSCPLAVSARGHKCLGDKLEDLAFATLDYPNNIMVNVHVSWLDPKKVRQITVVGDKKMAAWDDLDAEGPLKLYDKHVEKTAVYYETYGEFQLLSKEGSIMIPKIGFNEPLKTQAQYFIDCIQKNQPPVLADAKRAYDVVKTLCAIQESMNKQGQLVKL
jgi:predicted dehydrogenase